VGRLGEGVCLRSFGKGFMLEEWIAFLVFANLSSWIGLGDVGPGTALVVRLCRVDSAC
jgi:hypothetical protein